MPQPLSGLLVLDFTTLLPGPLATLMLAEAGAEVIKIERPGGEEMRRHPPVRGGDSVAFALLNRGKRSLVLDLKDRDDQARLAPLIARADILVEQFRPGVMERLGLGYAAVRRDQSAPRLLLDQRLRPERPARRRGRARSQLHRQYRPARARTRARPTGRPCRRRSSPTSAAAPFRP